MVAESWKEFLNLEQKKAEEYRLDLAKRMIQTNRKTGRDHVWHMVFN